MDPVKKDILEAGLVEFAQYGLEGTRVEAIAARTRTSKRMIYYHFGTKEGLYAEVLEYAYRKVRQSKVLVTLQHMPPLVALATYAGDAFDTFCEFPDFIRLVIQENLQGARFIGKSPAIREMNEGTFALLKELLQRGQADGSMRAELTPLNVYINFIGLCHYNISSRSTFLALFGHDLTLPQHRAARRESICDAIVRYARS